jgi:hypothetical protein
MSSPALAQVPTAVPRADSGSPWLVSAGFDSLFFLSSALAVVACWVASLWFHGDKAFYILAAVAVVSNGPHLTSTWTRVYLDTRELRRRPFAYLGGPLIVGAVVITLLARGQVIANQFPARGPLSLVHEHLRDPFRVLNSLVLYWATYHFAAQCYGLIRLYQRRSGEARRTAHRAESVFVFAVAAAGLLWRLSVGPRWLFGAEAIAPKDIPFGVVVAALAVVGGSLAWIVADQLTRARAGQAVAWSRLAFLGTVVFGFWIPFMVIKDGTAAFAAAACWHGFQYLGIVYHYNRRKFASGAQSSGAPVIAWLSQPRRWPLYAALLLVLAGSGFVMIQALAFVTGWTIWMSEAAVWLTLTFSHYLIDGLIWKLRRGDVATTLQAGTTNLAAA